MGLFIYLCLRQIRNRLRNYLKLLFSALRLCKLRNLDSKLRNFENGVISSWCLSSSLEGTFSQSNMQCYAPNLVPIFQEHRVSLPFRSWKFFQGSACVGISLVNRRMMEWWFNKRKKIGSTSRYDLYWIHIFDCFILSLMKLIRSYRGVGKISEVWGKERIYGISGGSGDGPSILVGGQVPPLPPPRFLRHCTDKLYFT